MKKNYKFLFIILTIYYPTSIFSALLCSDHLNSSNTIKDIISFAEKWNYTQGLTEQDYESSVCGSKDIPSDREISLYVEQLLKDRKPKVLSRNETKLPNGGDSPALHFKEEDPGLMKELISLFEPNNSYHQSIYQQNKDWKPGDKVKTHTKNDVVLKTLKCKDIICTLRNLHGKENADKMIFFKMKYGISPTLGPILSKAISNNLNWKNRDVKSIIKGLQAIPEKSRLKAINNSQNKLLKLSSASPRSSTGRTLANATLTFFKKNLDHSHNKNKCQLMGTVTHELLHLVAYNNKSEGLDETKEWLKLSGWKKVSNEKDGWTHSKDALFAEKYGETNPKEDLATASTLYIYKPETLKRLITKEKYEYLKKYVFEGVEFNNRANCRGISDKEVESFANQILPTIEKNEKELDQYIASGSYEQKRSYNCLTKLDEEENYYRDANLEDQKLKECLQEEYLNSIIFTEDNYKKIYGFIENSKAINKSLLREDIVNTLKRSLKDQLNMQQIAQKQFEILKLENANSIKLTNKESYRNSEKTKELIAIDFVKKTVPKPINLSNKKNETIFNICKKYNLSLGFRKNNELYQDANSCIDKLSEKENPKDLKIIFKEHIEKEHHPFYRKKILLMYSGLKDDAYAAYRKNRSNINFDHNKVAIQEEVQKLEDKIYGVYTDESYLSSIQKDIVKRMKEAPSCNDPQCGEQMLIKIILSDISKNIDLSHKDYNYIKNNENNSLHDNYSYRLNYTLVDKLKEMPTFKVLLKKAKKLEK